MVKNCYTIRNEDIRSFQFSSYADLESCAWSNTELHLKTSNPSAGSRRRKIGTSQRHVCRKVTGIVMS